MKEYGNVWMRYNLESGGSRDVEIFEPWIEPDDPASDVAMVPMGYPPGFDGLIAPARWFVTDDIVQSCQIGPGDEVAVMGLFSKHIGRDRNLPIIRGGQIASMPHEHLEDQASGRPFSAYLAEVRSIGGLSGSPVFVVLNPSNRWAEVNQGSGGQIFYLLGLIRGHWNHRQDEDSHVSEMEYLNTGIAIVTPITDLLPLFHDPRVTERDWIRRKFEAERRGHVQDLTDVPSAKAEEPGVETTD